MYIYYSTRALREISYATTVSISPISLKPFLFHLIQLSIRISKKLRNEHFVSILHAEKRMSYG